MSSPTCFNLPPIVGPFGRRKWKCGRWRTRLTVEGRTKLAAWLLDHPEPAKLLVTTSPQLAAAATAWGIDRQELNALCQVAAVRAMIHFNPNHPSECSFVSHVRWEMRNVVGAAIKQRRKADRWGVTVVEGDRPFAGDEATTVLDMLADHRAENPARRMEVEDLRRAMADVLRRRVSKRRDRQIFALRRGMHDGQEYTLDAVARAFNVTRERVRQIEAGVLLRVRDELAAIYRDHCLTA